MPVFADHLAKVYSEVPGGLTKTDINNPPPLHATVESHLPTYDMTLVDILPCTQAT